MRRAVVVLALVASCLAGHATAASAASPGSCDAAVTAYAHNQRSKTFERAAIVRCGSVAAWVQAVRAAYVGSKQTDLAATKGRARHSLDVACIGNDDLALCRRLASPSATTTLPPSTTSGLSMAALCASAHTAFREGQAIPEPESESILIREMAITGSSTEAQNLLDSLRRQPPDQQGDYGLVFIVAPLVKICNAKGL
jgi:hypothetical protein